MDFYQTTVGGLFGQQKIQFSIPAYQRAYSWEEKQLKTFLEDLLDQQVFKQANVYCFGNILLETIIKDRKYEIIDGQQRLTTISIFMCVLLNELKGRSNLEGALIKSDDEEIDFGDEYAIFFKSSGVVKLRPTSYDEACFQTLIVDNQDSFPCQTPSQKRISFAKTFFTQELRNLSTKELIKILETIEGAIINRIELVGKKESSLMFELQNNRGKDLTNLEKLKSFLMYQLYVFSVPDETENNINYVSNLFNQIYGIINQLNSQLNADNDEITGYDSLNEDRILIYHSYAYSKKNFGYRNLNDIIEEVKDISPEEKVEWIKSYTLNLFTSFSNINAVLHMSDDYLTKLKTLGIPFFVYPFIIKGFKNKNSISQLFKLMEVLSFRYKLVNSRADIRSRLTDLIRCFNGDINFLAEKINEKMNDAYYWGDKKMLEVLNANMYKNSIINYFLWEYEQNLQVRGYIISGEVSIDQESIEHISPQTETDEEKIASGYDIEDNGYYSKEFRDEYINKLGNLMIISQPHNSSVGNKPFKDKLNSYNTNPLLRQQMEIKKYVKDKDNPHWGKEEIDDRHKEMIEFAQKRWSFIQNN